MRNCQEVARLVSEGLDRRLSFFERIRVRLHMRACELCCLFADQIRFVSRLTRVAGRSGPGSPIEGEGAAKESLSPEAKARMREALSRRQS